MSDSVQPHRQQLTMLSCPWDSPGKSTGVGCHFLLQCMKVESESEVAHWCPALPDPMDCSPPGSTVHGNFQARVLEWGAIAFSIQTLKHFTLNMTYLSYKWECGWEISILRNILRTILNVLELALHAYNHVIISHMIMCICTVH